MKATPQISILTPSSQQETSKKTPPMTYILMICSFLVLGILLIVLGVLFLSKTTQKPPKSSISIKKTSLSVPTLAPSLPTPTKEPHLRVNKPSVDLSGAEIATSEGSVFLVEGDKKQLLIDSQANKNYFADFQVTMYFTEAKLSPDKSKIYVCAEGITSRPLLFYVNMNEVNDSHQIANCTQVVWSPNSRYIAFIDAIGDCGPDNINLGFYDTKLNKTSYLATFNHLPPISTLSFSAVLYNDLKWLPDSSGVTVGYTAYSGAQGCGMDRKEVGEGTLDFPLSKGFQTTL